MPAPADNHAPLRVALLSYRGKPHVGGQGVYVSRLSAALADLGHRVVVLGSDLMANAQLLHGWETALEDTDEP